ncbi:unnamed protein product [Polarella glacialis]|uniref:RRM domain-containing protein n=1 Tax=Polarella glacialis TaxID=89957 RepID=A0A813JSY1_POLGL|nr:unnamed protein product [Polarella glacialis]
MDKVQTERTLQSRAGSQARATMAASGAAKAKAVAAATAAARLNRIALHAHAMPKISLVFDNLPCTRLFVGNLPPEITTEALDYVFKSYGSVVKTHIMAGKSKSGQSCAFIEYSAANEAETAMLTLHEKYEIKPGAGPILVKRANSDGPRNGPY